MEKVHRREARRWNLASRLPYIIWGFQLVAGFRRRHVGTSIEDAWSSSLASVRTALDADPAHDRGVLLRATTREIASSRDEVLDVVTQRLDLPQKHAAEAYSLAERREANPVPSGATCKG